MGEEIKIGNPPEVLVRILQESKLLAEYAEQLKNDTKEFTRLESKLEETEQAVCNRIRRSHNLIEQYRSYGDSPEQQSAIADMQKELLFFEGQLQTVKQCKEDLISMQQDYSALMKECNFRADSGRVLAGKLDILINKIISAK